MFQYKSGIDWVIHQVKLRRRLPEGGEVQVPAAGTLAASMRRTAAGEPLGRSGVYD